MYYTGKGDKGKSEIGKKKISKDSLILETLGELDELNSLIGLVKNQINKDFRKKLEKIQNDLFIIQANIAWFLYPKFKAPDLEKEKIKKLEEEIEAIEKKIKPERGFVIPGSCLESAWIDYLRSVTRRVERRTVAFNTKFRTKFRKNKNILSYLNRLSSYFFALARLIAYDKAIRERKPSY